MTSSITTEELQVMHELAELGFSKAMASSYVSDGEVAQTNGHVPNKLFKQGRADFYKHRAILLVEAQELLLQRERLFNQVALEDFKDLFEVHRGLSAVYQQLAEHALSEDKQRRKDLLTWHYEHGIIQADFAGLCEATKTLLGLGPDALPAQASASDLLEKLHECVRSRADDLLKSKCYWLISRIFVESFVDFFKAKACEEKASREETARHQAEHYKNIAMVYLNGDYDEAQRAFEQMTESQRRLEELDDAATLAKQHEKMARQYIAPKCFDINKHIIALEQAASAHHDSLRTKSAGLERAKVYCALSRIYTDMACAYRDYPHANQMDEAAAKRHREQAEIYQRAATAEDQAVVVDEILSEEDFISNALDLSEFPVLKKAVFKQDAAGVLKALVNIANQANKSGENVNEARMKTLTESYFAYAVSQLDRPALEKFYKYLHKPEMVNLINCLFYMKFQGDHFSQDPVSDGVKHVTQAKCKSLYEIFQGLFDSVRYLGQKKRLGKLVVSNPVLQGIGLPDGMTIEPMGTNLKAINTVTKKLATGKLCLNVTRRAYMDSWGEVEGSMKYWFNPKRFFTSLKDVLEQLPAHISFEKFIDDLIPQLSTNHLLWLQRRLTSRSVSRVVRALADNQGEYESGDKLSEAIEQTIQTVEAELGTRGCRKLHTRPEFDLVDTFPRETKKLNSILAVAG